MHYGGLLEMCLYMKKQYLIVIFAYLAENVFLLAPNKIISVALK